jgi:hypothetical protein
MTTTPDLTNARRIAFADTSHLGRPRWTELAVHHVPQASDGKCWVAENVGRSSVAGEETRRVFLATFGLERALELFDDSAIGIAVKAQARDYAETQLGAHGHPASRERAAVPGEALESDQEALRWLFPSEMPRSHMARALGIGESTLRKQLGGTGVRVGLRHLLPFVDRDAFLASVTEQADA